MNSQTPVSFTQDLTLILDGTLPQQRKINWPWCGTDSGPEIDYPDTKLLYESLEMLVTARKLEATSA